MDGSTASYNSDIAATTVISFEEESFGCTEDDLYLPPAVRYVLTVFGFVLIVENMLMIVTIARNKELHTNTNILVASLAVSDVVIGLLCFQMTLISRPDGLRANLGIGESGLRAFDSFAGGANCGLIVVSMGHLAAVSVDRYLYILWPLHYFRRVTQRRVIVVAVGIWLACILYIILPIWVFSDLKYHRNCFLFNPPNEYAAGPLLCFLFVCIIVVCISTIGIAKLALEHGKKMEVRRNGSAWGKEIDRTTGNKQNCSLHYHKDKLNGSKESTEQSEAVPLATISSRVVAPSDSLYLTRSNESNGVLPSIPHLVSFSTKRGLVDRTTDLNQLNTKTNSHSLGIEESDDVLKVLEHNRDLMSSQISEAYDESLQVSETPNPQRPMEFDDAPKQEVGLADQRRSHPKQYDTHSKRNLERCAQRFDKAKLKVLKFVTMMFGSYFICVSPSIVLLIINKLLHVVHFSKSVVVCFTLILFLNSGINFFIMFHFNITFRTILSNSFPYKHLQSCFRNVREAFGSN